MPLWASKSLPMVSRGPIAAGFLPSEPIYPYCQSAKQARSFHIKSERARESFGYLAPDAGERAKNRYKTLTNLHMSGSSCIIRQPANFVK